MKYDELVEITILRTTSLYLRTAYDEEHGEWIAAFAETIRINCCMIHSYQSGASLFT